MRASRQAHLAERRAAAYRRVPARKNRGFAAPLGFCVALAGFAAAVLPTEIGHQDLAALVAQRQVAAERPRSHNIASPFGTIEAATFSLPRPISAAIPVSLSYALASLDPDNADITGSIRERMLGDIANDDGRDAQSALPEVNRRFKGDRLALHAEPADEAVPVAEAEPVPAKKGDRLAIVQVPELDQPSPPAGTVSACGRAKAWDIGGREPGAGSG